ncbi:hypothetical protein [Roseobacter sp.]|uniref:hypothetical protein n=1 Tax=Roseobacter sp. TaxID=1907202 RepID=UPI00296725B4|nr:hypothetical protein [Roseobacter sp.]MDW3181760.1 hypothetical protein [Roseobacter sp.]
MSRDPKLIAARQGHAERLVSEGEQLDMWGDEGAVVPVASRGPGRPAGATNKLKGKLRDYMAGQGYRDPAVQLAMMAGLDRPDLHPIAYAAQIAQALGEDTADVLKVMRQAASDVLPYYHAKLTPDVSVQAAQMNIMMAPQGAAGKASGREMRPPPMPGEEVEGNQEVSNSEEGGNSDGVRTE